MMQSANEARPLPFTSNKQCKLKLALMGKTCPKPFSSSCISNTLLWKVSANNLSLPNRNFYVQELPFLILRTFPTTSASAADQIDGCTVECGRFYVEVVFLCLGGIATPVEGVLHHSAEREGGVPPEGPWWVHGGKTGLVQWWRASIRHGWKATNNAGGHKIWNEDGICE